MATLNIIADEIIGALQRPFDVQFRERVKSALRHTFAGLIRQQVQKYGNDDQFNTHFYLDLIPKPAGVCNPDGDDSETCWQSEFPLPRPIRTSSDVPFVFVGTADHRVSFIYTAPYEMKYANMTEVYVDKPARYYFNNNKDLIVCNIPELYACPPEVTPSGPIPDPPIEDPCLDKLCIHVEGIFSPGVIGDGKWDGKDNVEFHDNMIIPMPDDLIQVAKDILLKGELAITDNKVAPELTHIDNE